MFYLKEYFCTKCHKYPKVELKNILEKYKKYSIEFADKIYKKARTGRKSLRKTSEDLKIDDVTLSHQSIANLLKTENTNELTFDIGELSGYYGYDEQYIDIMDKSYAKAQLIDIVSNRTIAIKFMEKITSNNVESFIKDHTSKNKRICLVSDHDHAYPSVVENLGFKRHQLCLFHLWEIIKRKVKAIIKKNNSNDDEKKELWSIQEE